MDEQSFPKAWYWNPKCFIKCSSKTNGTLQLGVGCTGSMLHFETVCTISCWAILSWANLGASFYRDLFLDRMQGKASSSAIRGDIFTIFAPSHIYIYILLYIHFFFKYMLCIFWYAVNSMGQHPRAPHWMKMESVVVVCFSTNIILCEGATIPWTVARKAGGSPNLTHI